MRLLDSELDAIARDPRRPVQSRNAAYLELQRRAWFRALEAAA